MTKILVLGSKGFLGSRVTNLLMQQQNTEVIPHDRSIFSLSDVAQLTSFLEFHRPDAIVNCAASVNFSSHVKDDYFYNVNVLVSAILASYSLNNNKFYVHASGTIVHGVRASYVSKNSPYNPDSPYGYSKYLAELNILASGSKNAIIRFGGIWGMEGPEHLGINKALRNASIGKQLTVAGGGSKKLYSC